MSRVVIDLPDNFSFSTELDVLISQINAGQHMGNEHIIGALNEARVRYIKSLGSDGFNVDGMQFINADLAIIYKGEAHHGDKLKVEVQTCNFGKYGCDFLFRVSNSANDKEIARAKAAFLLYDYQNQCLQLAPQNFADFFKSAT